MDEYDTRVIKDICGVTRIGPTGIEWICINEPHGAVYFRKKSDRTHRRGDPIFSDNPIVDKHYMVPRWPNRKKSEE